MRQRVPYRRIDVADFDALRRDDALVLDVRDAGAFATAHVDGALHVSHANVSAVLGATARSKHVLIYCYHGNASQEYAQTFSDFGFTEVFSLDGGYEAWRSAPRPREAIALDPALLQWLTGQGFAADVHATAANAITPLMRAAHLGDGMVVRLLLAAGAPVNARNADGNNALWLACVGRDGEVIDLLVDAGIDVDNRNDTGATPLMYAASAGLADVVARLLAAGADRAPETPDGFTALDLASTTDCLTLLRQARQGLTASGS